MLVNQALANKLVATEFGDINFNEHGESKDLKPEQEKKLGELPGFEYHEEKAAPKAKEKEEKPEEKEKVEAPKKKASKK
ncbi:hypothetical protein CPT_Moonbeam57 [Bacillus phage Moonbeam]|uniref:DUF7349 domain-containing protein n=1 Tax=Bacillus phage Moonbeam TaxID=1540091 RepID=A0A0A0RN06_9CAUD|nr:hypothetical protein CPT_Moonbeam57 [Bacillus phage Moonbeam]AIW03455.1 hypothetical protein CPT_Moonbeam57 [Bacillus phage Moonbeam]